MIHVRMPYIRRVLAGAVALSIGLVFAEVAPAEAGIKSRLRIDFIDYANNPDLFAGEVYSAKPRCAKNRFVKVFRQVPGRDERVGSTRTTTFFDPAPGGGQPRGYWRIEKEDPGDGRYYGKVTRKDDCERDRSRTITVNDNPGV